MLLTCNCCKKRRSLQKIININSHSLRRYFVNTSWLMAERVLRMIVALFVGVYVARYLGPERFGVLSYASSFVGLFTALATVGLDGIMVRELVKMPEHKDELLGTAFWLKAGGAILMWICIATSILFINNDTQTNIIIAIIAFGVIFQAVNVIDLNYQAEVKSKFVVWAQVVQLVVSSMAKLILIWLTAPLVWFACVFVLDAVVLAAGLAALHLTHTGKVWHWTCRWQTARVLLKDSWPLLFSGMVISIYMKIDQVMIKEMLDTSQVGLYAAAVRLSEAWHFIPMAITSSVFPAILNARKQSEDLYYERLQQLYDLMVWLAVAIALPTTFLAPWVIRVLYGEAFLPASGVLSIHIWAGIFSFLGIANGRWIITENMQRIAIIRSSAGAMTNVALNIVLIPKYGINGAATATFFSVFVASHFAFLFINKSKKVFMMQNKSFFRPVLWMMGK